MSRSSHSTRSAKHTVPKHAARAKKAVKAKKARKVAKHRARKAAPK